MNPTKPLVTYNNVVKNTYRATNQQTTRVNKPWLRATPLERDYTAAPSQEMVTFPEQLNTVHKVLLAVGEGIDHSEN